MYTAFKVTCIDDLEKINNILKGEDLELDILIDNEWSFNSDTQLTLYIILIILKTNHQLSASFYHFSILKSVNTYSPVGNYFIVLMYVRGRFWCQCSFRKGSYEIGIIWRHDYGSTE